MSNVQIRDGYLTEEELAAFAGQANVEGRIVGKCASCRFWHPEDEPVWVDVSLREAELLILEGRMRQPVKYEGACRRHAPVQMLCQIDPENSPWDVGGVWPDTSWEEWCGDYVRARDGMPFEEEDEP